MLDVRRYLVEEKGGRSPKGRIDEVSIDCPACGKGDFHFSFNVFKRKGGCFHCNYAVYDTASLIRKLEGISESQARAFNQTGVFQNSRADIVMKLLDNEEIEQPEIENKYHVNSFLSRDYVPIYEQGRNPEILIPSVFKRRNYSIETIKKLKIGYCISGPYAARLIFPIYCRSMVSFYARRIFDWMPQKYKNPTDSKHSLLLYNYDNIPRNAEKIFVTEGATDVCRLMDRNYFAVATSGKKISTEQIDLLVDLYPKEVIFTYDADAIKANISSFEKASNRLNASFVILPKKGDDKGQTHYYDPDDCPEDLFQEAVRNRTGLIRSDKVIKILNRSGGTYGKY